MTKNILWVLLEKGGMQTISFILFIIIARLLGPEEYGLAMLCFIFLSLAQMILGGMSEGVVTLQLTEAKKDQLSTLFWVIMATGFLISLLILILAYNIPKILDIENASNLLFWLSVIPLLISLQAVPQMIIMQKLSFHIYAIRSLTATTLSGIVGIYLAYNEYGALALVIQQIVLYILFNLIIWYYIDWRPTFIFDTKKSRETLNPGIRMIYSNSLSFVDQQLPRFYLGLNQNITSVGYYAFSHRMRFALQDILMTPLFMVLFPTLSQSINNKNKDEYEKTISYIILAIGIITFPSITLAVLTAPFYIPLFLGEEWIGAIGFLQLFISLGYLIPFIKLSEILFRAHNRVDSFLKGQIGLISISTFLIFIASFIDLIVIGWVIAIITLTSIPVYFELLRRYLKIHIWSYCADLWKPIISCTIMAASVHLMMKYLIINISLAGFIILNFVGLCIYFIMTFFLQRNIITETFKKIKLH